MAIEKVSVIKLDTSPAVTSVKDLRQELKAQKDAMLSAEQGSKEYTAALQQAANIQHTLKEQMEEVNASAMDFGQIASNVTKTVGGMVAGIQAGNAVMNLMGYESEDVAKSLQKMQNLMAITQALPSLDNGFKAFKRLSTAISTAAGATSKFSKALISTGLGAIAVALGYIVTHFEDISKWLDEVTGQTNLVATIIDNILAALDTGMVAVVESLKLVGTAIKNHVLAPFKSTMAAINAYMGTDGTFADKMKAAAKAMKNSFVDSYKEIGDQAKNLGATVSSNFSANLTARVDARTKAEKEKAEKERKEREEKNLTEQEAERKAREKDLEDYAKWSRDMEKARMTSYQKQVADLDDWKAEEEKRLKGWYDKGRINYETYMKSMEDITNEYGRRLMAIQKDQKAIQAKNALETYQKTYEEIKKKAADLNRDLSDMDYEILSSTISNKIKALGDGWQAEINQRAADGINNSVSDYMKNLEANYRTQLGTTLAELENQLTQLVSGQEMFHQYFAGDDGAIEAYDEQIATLKDDIAALQHQILMFDVEKEREQMDFLRDYADETANAMDLILGTGQGLSGYWTEAFETMSNSLINLGQTLREGKGDWSDYAKVAAAGLYTVGSIMSALAEEQNADTEEGFEQQKKYQIAAATMNMLGGITAAWVSALNPANAWMTIWGQIGMGAATTAMLLATGLMQIQKIKEQQFDGGGGGASSSSGLGGGMGSGTLGTLVAPVQYTQDVQGADIENALADQRVYVLESDISGTQRRVNVAEGEARY